MFFTVTFFSVSSRGAGMVQKCQQDDICVLPIEFAVGSCLCTKGFSPGTLGFLPSTRTKIPKFKLELETVDELSRSVEAAYHKIPIYLFTATPGKFHCNFDTPNSICLNLLNCSYTHLCTR